jgi:hypothetical protein
MGSIVARLASNKDQQRDYMQTLCRTKKRKKVTEFTYQNDDFFIQIMAGQTIVDCLPKTGLENVDVDLRNRQLRVTFYPEAFRMDRIVNMLARPEYVPGTATVQDPKVVYNLWGIEASRVCLNIELQKACSTLGSIHEMHCRVLADAMTLSGELVSLNRFGFRRSHPNPFSRCTFERNGLTFIQETLSQTTEMCNNNFKFLMGSRGTLGTNYFTTKEDAQG